MEAAGGAAARMAPAGLSTPSGAYGTAPSASTEGRPTAAAAGAGVGLLTAAESSPRQSAAPQQLDGGRAPAVHDGGGRGCGRCGSGGRGAAAGRRGAAFAQPDQRAGSVPVEPSGAGAGPSGGGASPSQPAGTQPPMLLRVAKRSFHLCGLSALRAAFPLQVQAARVRGAIQTVQVYGKLPTATADGDDDASGGGGEQMRAYNVVLTPFGDDEHVSDVLLCGGGVKQLIQDLRLDHGDDVQLTTSPAEGRVVAQAAASNAGTCRLHLSASSLYSSNHVHVLNSFVVRLLGRQLAERVSRGDEYVVEAITASCAAGPPGQEQQQDQRQGQQRGQQQEQQQGQQEQAVQGQGQRQSAAAGAAAGQGGDGEAAQGQQQQRHQEQQQQGQEEEEEIPSKGTLRGYEKPGQRCLQWQIYGLTRWLHAQGAQVGDFLVIGRKALEAAADAAAGDATGPAAVAAAATASAGPGASEITAATATAEGGPSGCAGDGSGAKPVITIRLEKAAEPAAQQHAGGGAGAGPGPSRARGRGRGRGSRGGLGLGWGGRGGRGVRSGDRGRGRGRGRGRVARARAEAVPSDSWGDCDGDSDSDSGSENSGASANCAGRPAGGGSANSSDADGEGGTARGSDDEAVATAPAAVPAAAIGAATEVPPTVPLHLQRSALSAQAAAVQAVLPAAFQGARRAGCQPLRLFTRAAAAAGGELTPHDVTLTLNGSSCYFTGAGAAALLRQLRAGSAGSTNLVRLMLNPDGRPVVATEEFAQVAAAAAAAEAASVEAAAVEVAAASAAPGAAPLGAAWGSTQAQVQEPCSAQGEGQGQYQRPVVKVEFAHDTDAMQCAAGVQIGIRRDQGEQLAPTHRGVQQPEEPPVRAAKRVRGVLWRPAGAAAPSAVAAAGAEAAGPVGSPALPTRPRQPGAAVTVAVKQEDGQSDDVQGPSARQPSPSAPNSGSGHSLPRAPCVSSLPATPMPGATETIALAALGAGHGFQPSLPCHGAARPRVIKLEREAHEKGAMVLGPMRSVAAAAQGVLGCAVPPALLPRGEEESTSRLVPAAFGGIQGACTPPTIGPANGAGMETPAAGGRGTGKPGGAAVLSLPAGASLAAMQPHHGAGGGTVSDRCRPTGQDEAGARQPGVTTPAPHGFSSTEPLAGAAAAAGAPDIMVISDSSDDEPGTPGKAGRELVLKREGDRMSDGDGAAADAGAGAADGRTLCGPRQPASSSPQSRNAPDVQAGSGLGAIVPCGAEQAAAAGYAPGASGTVAGGGRCFRPMSPDVTAVGGMVRGMLGLMEELAWQGEQDRDVRRALRQLKALNKDEYLEVSYLTLCSAVRAGNEEEVREVFADMVKEAAGGPTQPDAADGRNGLTAAGGLRDRRDGPEDGDRLRKRHRTVL